MKDDNNPMQSARAAPRCCAMLREIKVHRPTLPRPSCQRLARLPAARRGRRASLGAGSSVVEAWHAGVGMAG
jgi:hypothetical protein